MRPRNGHACVASGDARVRLHPALPEEEQLHAELSLLTPLHLSQLKVVHLSSQPQLESTMEATRIPFHNGSHCALNPRAAHLWLDASSSFSQLSSSFRVLLTARLRGA